MKDSKKSSRVPPAQAADIRQAKNLLPKDRPARVGFKPKTSHSNAVRSNNHLAWYVALNTKHLEKKNPHIPQIKWKCPPKFALNTGWRVAAGEESQEAEAQKCRESAALEVVYNDLTAIPPCPFTSSTVEGNCHDDSQTPIIPLIPIEEVAAEMPFDTSMTVNTSINPQPPASCPSVSEDLPVSQGDPSESQDQSVLGKSLPHMLHGLESGDLEIAAATVAAVMQSKDQIDAELLIKFLSDPEMIKKLMSENGFTSKPEDKAPPEPKATTCSHLPSLTPASVVDKLDNGGNEPASKTILSNSTLEPVSQSLIKTEIKKAASKVGGMHAGSGPNHASKAAKGPSHSPRFNSDRPTKKLPAFSRTNQISRQEKVRPLVPSILRPGEESIGRLVKNYGGPDISSVKPIDPLNSSPSMLNLEVAKKMIHDYGAPDVARVNPMAHLVASASMPPPNLEEIHRNMEKCLLPDHGLRMPFMGPIPSLLSSTASPPMANLSESHVDATDFVMLQPIDIPLAGDDAIEIYKFYANKMAARAAVAAAKRKVSVELPPPPPPPCTQTKKRRVVEVDTSDWSNDNITLTFPSSASCHSNFGPHADEVKKLLWPKDKATFEQLGSASVGRSGIHHAFQSVQILIFLTDKVEELEGQVEVSRAEEVALCAEHEMIMSCKIEVDRLAAELLNLRALDASRMQSALSEVEFLKAQVAKLKVHAKMMDDYMNRRATSWNVDKIYTDCEELEQIIASEAVPTDEPARVLGGMSRGGSDKRGG